MTSILVAERVRAAFRELEGALLAIVEADEWVDQKTSPLGRRQHCRLASTGKLDARKVGRLWLVRRSTLDAYILRAGEQGASALDSENRLTNIDTFRASRKRTKSA